MTDNGRVWTETELAQYWDMSLFETRQRMIVVSARGKGDLLTLYYWKDEPDSPPIAMRRHRAFPARFDNVTSSLGLIFRDCTPDDAPQSYRSQIAAWTPYRKENRT